MSKNQRLNEQGMVSIVVTMIMLIVISLIVLGFATIARHNQREVLDRQLGTQAFYAAETGVNDVINLIGHGYDPATDNTNYDSCAAGDIHNFVFKHPGMNTTLDSSTKTGYTCLLVTPQVPDVPVNVSLGSNKVEHIQPSASTPLTFTWDTSDPDNGSAASCPTAATINRFEDANSWKSVCPYGILRVDIFNAASGATTADAMAANTASLYIVPDTSGPASTGLNFGQAQVIAATCDAAINKNKCSATVTGGGTDYYVRLSAIYNSLGTVKIKAASGVTFSGVHLLVDATGKAQDQVKRIQVRVPLTGGDNEPPMYALAATDQICKRFTTIGGTSTADPDWNSATPLCGP